MNIQEMIELLNEDLSREYAHWNFYIHAGTRVQGLHREEFSEFFLKEAESEMKHIEEFKRLIIGLGGEPTVEPAHFVSNLTGVVSLLREAVRMEDAVVSNYVDRISQAEAMQETGTAQEVIDGKYIELFLEEQILHSRGDADHMREMLKGIE